MELLQEPPRRVECDKRGVLKLWARVASTFWPPPLAAVLIFAVTVLAASAEPRGEMFFTAKGIFLTGVPAAAALAPWQLAVTLAGAVVWIFPCSSSQRGEKLQQSVREWSANVQLSYTLWAYLLHTLKLKHAAKVHVAVLVFTSLSSCLSSLGS